VAGAKAMPYMFAIAEAVTMCAMGVAAAWGRGRSANEEEMFSN